MVHLAGVGISRNYLCMLANHPAIVGEALPMQNLASSPCLSHADLVAELYPRHPAQWFALLHALPLLLVLARSSASRAGEDGG